MSLVLIFTSLLSSTVAHAGPNSITIGCDTSGSTKRCLELEKGTTNGYRVDVTGHRPCTESFVGYMKINGKEQKFMLGGVVQIPDDTTVFFQAACNDSTGGYALAGSFHQP